MHRTTDQGLSSSLTPLSQFLSSEGSSSISRNTGGQGSSSNLIDLTQPRPTRIVHPRTLPSQSIEIIDLSSDDDESSYSSHPINSSNSHNNHNDHNSDDEVFFVRETPGTTATPTPARALPPPAWAPASVRSSSSRHGSASIGANGLDRRQAASSSSSSSSYPETLLHAYHQGRHTSFPRSQEASGLTRNRSENYIPPFYDRLISRRSPPLFHPYTSTNAPPTHPSSSTPTRASGSRLGSGSGSGPGSGPGALHTPESTSIRAIMSAMRTPPRATRPSDSTRAFPRSERDLVHALATLFGEEQAQRGRIFGREAPSNGTFIHTHHHYWDDGGWDIPYRERSPSVFGELLERLGAFDGAPPAATEAEVERERSEIETKPVVTRPGFTKSIDPATVITCPLCTKEFGHDVDLRPTLWVIVGCGHVVCGTCAEEIFISRKVIRGTTKGRRRSLLRKAKGKGKAKWSPGPNDMETGGEDEGLDTTSDGHAPASPISTITATTATAVPVDINVKVTKKVTGNCPGCQRKIKNTSLQQLYL